MNILRLAGELFLLYILYKFIFDFVIPIYNTTKKVKKQFGEMSEKMNQQMNSPNNFQANNRQTSNPVNTPSKKEDYIDYEEVK